MIKVKARFSALVQGVTFYAITPDQDPDLGMLALICRVVEGVNGGIPMQRSLGLLWLLIKGVAMPARRQSA